MVEISPPKNCEGVGYVPCATYSNSTYDWFATCRPETEWEVAVDCAALWRFRNEWGGGCPQTKKGAFEWTGPFLAKETLPNMPGLNNNRPGADNYASQRYTRLKGQIAVAVIWLNASRFTNVGLSYACFMTQPSQTFPSGSLIPPAGPTPRWRTDEAYSDHD